MWKEVNSMSLKKKKSSQKTEQYNFIFIKLCMFLQCADMYICEYIFVYTHRNRDTELQNASKYNYGWQDFNRFSVLNVNILFS